jgi:putative RecB family exonuclease
VGPPTVCGVTETPSTSTVERPTERPAEPADVDASGAGEVPRRPALSPSRAADFKQCPLLYRFRAIDRLPERPSPAQLRGTLVHAVLERLHGLPAAERLPAAAHALVAPAWAALCEADPTLLDGLSAAVEEAVDATDTEPTPSDEPAGAEPIPAGAGGVDALLDGAHVLLDAYFTLEDPRQVEPEARELLVEAELAPGLLLRGYVDRVDALGPDRPDGADAATDIRVVDYKTGVAPRPQGEARALFQMKFYALVLLLLRGRPPGELRLMYLTRPEALTYVPDETQLHRFGRTLAAMWTAIRTAGATGDFRPNPGPGCAWCDHRARCPAWGGTPPPYPGWPDADRDPAADDGPAP